MACRCAASIPRRASATHSAQSARPGTAPLGRTPRRYPRRHGLRSQRRPRTGSTAGSASDSSTPPTCPRFTAPGRSLAGGTLMSPSIWPISRAAGRRVSAAPENPRPARPVSLSSALSVHRPCQDTPQTFDGLDRLSGGFSLVGQGQQTALASPQTPSKRSGEYGRLHMPGGATQRERGGETARDTGRYSTGPARLVVTYSALSPGDKSQVKPTPLVTGPPSTRPRRRNRTGTKSYQAVRLHTPAGVAYHMVPSTKGCHMVPSCTPRYRVVPRGETDPSIRL